MLAIDFSVNGLTKVTQVGNFEKYKNYRTLSLNEKLFEWNLVYKWLAPINLFIYLFIEIYASSGPYSSEQVSPVKSSVRGKQYAHIRSVENAVNEKIVVHPLGEMYKNGIIYSCLFRDILVFKVEAPVDPKQSRKRLRC